jgi:hypothetical protein
VWTRQFGPAVEKRRRSTRIPSSRVEALEGGALHAACNDAMVPELSGQPQQELPEER